MRFRRKIKKWVPCLLLAAFLLESRQVPVSADASVKKGSCGETAEFTIDKDWTLTITGTGKVDKVFSDDDKIKYEKIKKIVVSEGITEFGVSCFECLDHVGTIECPDSLNIIGERALFSMNNLEKIELPDQLTKIGNYAFAQNKKLEEISIPDSVSQIGAGIFRFCENLQRVRLPKECKKIEDEMFMCCTSLNITGISNMDAVQEIGGNGFCGCDSFEKIVVPDSVKKIKWQAFGFCKKMKKITIGSSAKKVAKSYTKGSIRLRKIVSHSDTEIPLWDEKGKLTWRVGNKQRTTLPAGKTAKARAKKYKINYYLNGAQIKGKYPKYHEYGKETKLPSRVKRKGCVFLGWDLYGDKPYYDWGLVQSRVKAKSWGNLNVYAVCKRYKVTVKNRRIQVTVTDPYGFSKEDDYYGFRYSENEDMSHSYIVNETAPYGKGVSKKLKKGKTYYVEIAPHGPDFYEEDDEDFPIFGWRAKRKVKIK